MFLGAGGAGRGIPARRAGASPVGVLLAPRTGGETRRQDPRCSTQVSFGLEGARNLVAESGCPRSGPAWSL